MLTMLPITEQAQIMRQVAVVKMNEVFQILSMYEPCTELLWAEMHLKTAGQWVDSVIINGTMKNATIPPVAPDHDGHNHPMPENDVAGTTNNEAQVNPAASDTTLENANAQRL